MWRCAQDFWLLHASLPSFCPCRQLGYVQTINGLAIVWNLFFFQPSRQAPWRLPAPTRTHTQRQGTEVCGNEQNLHPQVWRLLSWGGSLLNFSLPPKSSHFSNLTLRFRLQLGFYFPAELEFLVPYGWAAYSAEKPPIGSSFECWLPSSSCLFLGALQCSQVDIVCILFIGNNCFLRGL